MMNVGMGVTGGGGFQFSPEELDAVIADWEALLEDVREDQTNILYARESALPPAEDVASVGFVRAVVDGLAAFQESNSSMVAYIEDYIGKLRRAKDGNEQTETGNADTAGSFLKAVEA